jgi:hypothetical protein
LFCILLNAKILESFSNGNFIMKFYLISFLLFSPSLFAHRIKNARTNVNGYEGATQNSYGGYGYYYGSSDDIRSEAAAYALGDFNCRDFEQLSSDDIICESGNCYTGQVNALYNSSVEVSRKAKIQATFDKLRDKALEYFALNLQAATSGSSEATSTRDLLTSDSGGFCPRQASRREESLDLFSGENNKFKLPEPLPDCYCKLSPGSDLSQYKGLQSPGFNTIVRKQNIIEQGMKPLSMMMAVLAREISVSVMGVRAKRPNAERRHDEMPFFKRDITQYRFYRDLGVDPEDGDTDHDDGDYNCKRFGRSFRKNQAMSNRGKDFRNYCQAWGAELYRLETNFPHLYRDADRKRYAFSYDPNAKEADAIYDYQVSVKRNGEYKAAFKPGLLSGAKEVYELMGGSWSDLMKGIASGRRTEIEKFKKTFEMDKSYVKLFKRLTVQQKR